MAHHSPSLAGGTAFPVYAIRSRWSMANVGQYLHRIGRVGILKTHTTGLIGLVDPDVQRKLIERKCASVTMTPYLPDRTEYPKAGYSFSLYLPKPNLLASTERLRTVMVDWMNTFASFGLMPAGSWSLSITDRACFIDFTSTTNREAIVLIKILLDGIEVDRMIAVRCLWSRSSSGSKPKMDDTHLEMGRSVKVEALPPIVKIKPRVPTAVE
jgi:hypothetical protein